LRTASWNRGRSVAFFSQSHLQYGLEFRYPCDGHFPNLVQVDSDIVVDEHVTHAADRFQSSEASRLRVSDETRLAALPDHFPISDDSILQLPGSPEGIPSRPDEAGNTFAPDRPCARQAARQDSHRRKSPSPYPRRSSILNAARSRCSDCNCMKSRETRPPVAEAVRSL
jgi:hypothetical protein